MFSVQNPDFFDMKNTYFLSRGPDFFEITIILYSMIQSLDREGLKPPTA